MTSAIARIAQTLPARSNACDRALEQIAGCKTLADWVCVIPDLDFENMTAIEEALVWSYLNEIRGSFRLKRIVASEQSLPMPQEPRSRDESRAGVSAVPKRLNFAGGAASPISSAAAGRGSVESRPPVALPAEQ